MRFKADKRAREVRKIMKREKKAERKRLRKAGIMGPETPGEPTPPSAAVPPQAPAPPTAPETRQGKEPGAQPIGK